MEELYNSALSQSVYASPPSYTTFPSMIVYNDINIIIMMDGAANRNNFKGVNSWFKDILIKTPAF